MSSLKHSLDSVAPASGGISKVSHGVSITTDLQDVLNGRTYLTGDMQEGDIVFWLGTGCHDSTNITGYLPPIFHNQLFTPLTTDYSGGTYKSSLVVHYHVLTTASKGMLIGFFNLMANNYSSPVNFLYVVRGVDPNSITTFEKTRRTTTAKPTFPAIDISSSDYILAMTASGANTTNYLPFIPSAGYDDFVSQGAGGLGSSSRLVSSGILLRKPGVSGSYTEPTWDIAGTNQTYFTNTSLVIKLSPK